MVIDINPEIFSLGPLHVRWYGMMYVIGFMLGTQLLKKLCRDGFVVMDEDKVDSLVTHLLIFMIVFARVFYVFIYGEWDGFVDLISVHKGGLSFHGAAVGFILAMFLFAKKSGLRFFSVTDLVTLGVPQGLFWGRLGNFINMELYGRPTDSWIGMVFATDPAKLPRHPSQLYQALGEGLLLMAFLWWYKKRAKYHGEIGVLFLIGYGVLRYFVEFFREADPQMGYYFGGTTTMGQILCGLMVIAGILIWQIVQKQAIPLRDRASNYLPEEKAVTKKPKKEKRKKRKK